MCFVEPCTLGSLLILQGKWRKFQTRNDPSSLSTPRPVKGMCCPARDSCPSTKSPGRHRLHPLSWLSSFLLAVLILPIHLFPWMEITRRLGSEHRIPTAVLVGREPVDREKSVCRGGRESHPLCSCLELALFSDEG